MSLRPTNITLDRTQHKLIIDWSTGEQCEYTLSVLREACPCVECRGGHHKMGIENTPSNLNLLRLEPARSYGVENLEIVGNYALQFFWDDGHHSGIYTWEYLHHLCTKLQSDEEAE